MSGVLGTMAYKTYFGYPRSYGQGAITAAMPFGSLFGALASSFIADKYSRRTAIQVAAVIWVIGSMLVFSALVRVIFLLNFCRFQCAANGIPLLVIGRAVAGVCVGIGVLLSLQIMSKNKPNRFANITTNIMSPNANYN